MTYLDHLAEKYQGDFPIEWRKYMRQIIICILVALATMAVRG